MRKSRFSGVLLASIFAAILISGQIAFADPNLVSWWKFDEGSGSTAHDSAGSNNGTLVNNPTWTTGQIGGALSFDGINDYVSLSSFTVSTNNGTIALWFKTSADFSANYGGQGNLISQDSQYYGYLAVSGNGTAPYGIYGENNLNDDYFVGVANVASAGVWNHVAACFSNKTVTTYLNGVPIDTRSVTSSALTLDRIGGRTQVFFNGKIDDVRIYNRALSAGEILQLYMEGLGSIASAPNPANGAIGVATNVVLRWSAGTDAASHDVYLGTNYNDVNNANTPSPEYKGNFDVNSFSPSGLDFMTTYYWRIDEVNGPNLWKGSVWNLKTRDNDNSKLSVPTEYETIQAAINDSVSGDTVIVAPGTYTGNGNRDIDFLGKAITVRSTDPNNPCVVAATVIDCESSTGHRGFYFHSGEDGNSIVSGLTITRGRVTGNPATGGGICCSGSSSTIKNCVITNNLAIGDGGSGNGQSACGGGVYCISNSHLTLIDCNISGNNAAGGAGGNVDCDGEGNCYGTLGTGGYGYGGGICSCTNSSLTIIGCKITGNTANGGAGGTKISCGGYPCYPHPVDGRGGGTAYGGGIYCTPDSNATVTGSIINNNTALGGRGGEIDPEELAGQAYGGGAIGRLVMRNCTISQNTASTLFGPFVELKGAGLLLMSGSSEITNCLITDNNATIGGMISGGVEGTTITCADQSQVAISNCTIAGNRSSGPTVSSSGSLVCSDCILWDNNSRNGLDISGASSVVYCCTEQNVSGTGNIHTDPCFVTGPDGNYYLSQIASGQAFDSPCVNAGSDMAANLGMDSFTTRTDEMTDEGIVDMGYHYPSFNIADIDRDGDVDFVDFAILASQWLRAPGVPSADIAPPSGDGIVDSCDLSLFVDNWPFPILTRPPSKATSPSPANQATGVNIYTDLSWTAGLGATSHDVYFGTTSPGTFQGNQPGTTFDTGTLDANTTYYWRIDEKNSGGTTTGDVWSFTTRPGGGVVDPNLAGWWKFDEGSGTTAYDSAGNNNGTIYYATWTSGQIGGALSFDGSDSYVSVPDNDNSLDMDNEMTITAWIKPSSVDVLCIVSKVGEATNYVFEIIFGTLELFDDYGDYYSTSNVTTGVWQHVAVTLKKGDSVKFYINGAPAGTSAQTTPFGSVNNEPLVIGMAGAYFDPFNGDIDEVRIYNRALSAGEIQQIYEEEL